MPTYEYKCLHCGHNFDVSQKMSDKPVEHCPKCNHKVKRLISSGIGVIFKGTGFYATDYRKKSKSDTSRITPNTCPRAKEGCNACKPQE